MKWNQIKSNWASQLTSHIIGLNTGDIDNTNTECFHHCEGVYWTVWFQSLRGTGNLLRPLAELPAWWSINGLHLGCDISPPSSRWGEDEESWCWSALTPSSYHGCCKMLFFQVCHAMKNSAKHLPLSSDENRLKSGQTQIMPLISDTISEPAKSLASRFTKAIMG